ncbi:hypothetical protein DOE76_13955 [Leifsonia sp. ku-ls]|nr:hypothetical protein DOE76_13955 [Leifsonia sp. ku-ls]
MANGDAAVSKGMAVVPGTDDIRKANDEINKTRDYIAADRDAIALKLDASKVKIQQSDPGNVPDGTLWISWV